MFADSHCHLNMLDGDIQQAIDDAKKNGVDYFLNVAVTLSDHPQLLKTAQSHKDVFISVGLHPNELPGEAIQTQDILRLITDPKIVAIGETGLDYFRSQGELGWQQRRFEQHIEAAQQCKKPLIIHTRDAKEDTLAIMRAQNAAQTGGVMHCFTEDWDMAKAAMDLNFYISFSGIVTFKNALQIQDVAKRMPLERMLIETDSPYLAPVPHRGKPNAPAYVGHVAEFIAAMRGVPVETIAQHTTQNFFTLFQIPQ